MKKCSEVMTSNPICCLPTDMVQEAARLMRRENIGAIPVIKDEKTRKLVGIITDRDLALRIVAEGVEAKSTTVEAAMTHTVSTCFADDDLQKVLDSMAEQQLRRILVVDNDNRLVGIISQADVATRAGQPEDTAEMIREISQTRSR